MGLFQSDQFSIWENNLFFFVSILHLRIQGYKVVEYSWIVLNLRYFTCKEQIEYIWPLLSFYVLLQTKRKTQLIQFTKFTSFYQKRIGEFNSTKEYEKTSREVVENRKECMGFP